MINILAEWGVGEVKSRQSGIRMVCNEGAVEAMVCGIRLSWKIVTMLRVIWKEHDVE